MRRLAQRPTRILRPFVRPGMRVVEPGCGMGFEGRLDIRLAQADRLGIADLAGQVDLVLAFYVVHELEQPAAFFAEITTALKADGAVLVAEPPLHVSRAAFETSLAAAERAGLRVARRPRIGPNKVALLMKSAA